MPTHEVQNHRYLHDDVWAEVLIRYCRRVRERRCFTFDKLSEQLHTQLGITQTTGNLKTKLNRGNHSAQLLLMCIYVMGEPEINMEEVGEILKEVHNTKNQ